MQRSATARFWLSTLDSKLSTFMLSLSQQMIVNVVRRRVVDAWSIRCTLVPKYDVDLHRRDRARRASVAAPNTADWVRR